MTSSIQARVPFTISSQSITFYIKGRPHSLTKDHPEFANLKAALQADGAHDIDQLLGFTDARIALLRASHGQITIIGDDIVWQGKALHNVWVDRIMQFRAAGEPFDVLWAALGRLVTNPTPQAIERLPNFLERCNLGFLTDGRFIAFKGVRDTYYDHYSGRFRNQVGDVLEMPRDEVDPNPNQTCSTGLHVGAPEYVARYYDRSSSKIMLVAVAPEDVVAVPTDYNGEKMRVCKYEVIDEVDPEYQAELLSRAGTVVRRYDPAPAPVAPAAPFDITDVKVGDVVSYAGDTDDCPAGNYSVIEVDDGDDISMRLKVATSTGQTWLWNSQVTGIVDPVSNPDPEDDDQVEDEDEDEDEGDDVAHTGAAYDAKLGDYIEYETGGDTYVGRVLKVDENDDQDRLQVAGLDGAGRWVHNDNVIRIIPAAELTGVMVAIIGDKVDLVGDPLIRDGSHEITEVNDQDGGDQFDPEGFTFMINVNDVQSVAVRNRGIVRVYRNSALVWPPLAEGVTMTKDDAGDVHLVSVAGVDLRTVVPAPVVIPNDLLAQVGDLVTTTEGGWPPAGVYPVVRIDEGSQEYRVIVQTQHDGEQAVRACYISLLTQRPWMRAEIGGRVTVSDDPLNMPAGGTYEVVDLMLQGDNPQIQVRTVVGNWWVAAERVTEGFPRA